MRRREWWIAGLWSTVTIGAGSRLMSLHLPLRAPGKQLAKRCTAGPDEHWAILHILGAECACSAQIAAYLAERGRRRDVHEDVIFFGEPNPAVAKRLPPRGFRVQYLPTSAQQDLDVSAVPAFLVLNRAREVCFSGGYGTGRGTDLRVLEEVQLGRQPDAIPVLGCARKRRMT